MLRILSAQVSSETNRNTKEYKLLENGMYDTDLKAYKQIHRKIDGSKRWIT